MRHFISYRPFLRLLLLAALCLPVLANAAGINPPTPVNPAASIINAITGAAGGSAAPVPALPPVQAPEALPPASSRDIEQTLRTLEDPIARDRLIRELRAIQQVDTSPAGRRLQNPAAPQGASQPVSSTYAANSGAPSSALGSFILDEFSLKMRGFGRQLVGLAASFAALPQGTAWLQSQIEDPLVRQRWLLLGMELLDVIGGASLVSFLLKATLRDARRTLSAGDPQGVGSLLFYTVLRLAVLALPVLAFAFIAFASLTLTNPSRVIRVVTLAIVNAVLLTQWVVLLAKLALAPNAPRLRLSHMRDDTALHAYVWLRRFAILIIWAYFIVTVGVTLGLPQSAADGLARIFGLGIVCTAVAFVLQVRQPVSVWLAGGNEKIISRDGQLPAEDYSALHLLRIRFAEVWHIIAITYLVLGFFVGALSIAGGFTFLLRGTLTTLAVVVLIRVGLVLLHRGMTRGITVSNEFRRHYPGFEQRANGYLPLIEKFVRLFLWISAVFAIASAWGINAYGMLATPAGSRISSAILSILITLAISIIAWEVVSSIVERYLNQDMGSIRSRRGARARTLLPILHNASLFLIVVIAGFSILAEIGINATPLLAGAGIIGVAIGFGSQSLVQDLVTGLFIVVEDTIAVGDIIKIGDHNGVVEAMTIRTIKVRDLSGFLHVLTYSEVKGLINQSKGFSYAVIELGIAYTANIDQAFAVMKDEVERMRHEAEFEPFILEPLDIQGVEKFTDLAIFLQVRLKVLPDNLRRIKRELNRRFKLRFDREGISMPYTASAYTVPSPAKAAELPETEENLPAKTLPAAI